MHDLIKKYKKYSFCEILKLLFFITYTKVIIPNARIIRYPIDIRGRKNIEFGKKFTAGYHCRLETHASSKEKVLIIGQNVQINDFVHIAAKQSLVIGNNVLIASKVFISDISHGSYNGDVFDSEPETAPQKRKLVSKPVLIDENVWIGESVSILPGVRIGKASIVGANSVVTKNIPDYCIAAGNPAKVIKRYNFNIGHWEKVSC